MAPNQRFRKFLRNYFSPRTKIFVFWLFGIGAFFTYVCPLGDLFPKFRRVSDSAIEYAVAAGSMLVARGFGHLLYDELKGSGAFKALTLASSGLVIVAFIFVMLSVSLRPRFPLYLISSHRGQAAAIVILFSAAYGFFAQRRNYRKRSG